MTYRYNQRVQVQGFDLSCQETWESAQIRKPRPSELPKPGPDWYVVEFADGGKLYIHESRLQPVTH